MDSYDELRSAKRRLESMNGNLHMAMRMIDEAMEKATISGGSDEDEDEALAREPGAEFPRKSETRQGKTRCYTVEARSMNQPMQCNGVLLGHEWHRMHFREAPLNLGVPRGSRYEIGLLDELDMLDYQAAQALRWWLHAQAYAEPIGASPYALETRLVEHEVKYSFQVKALAAHEVVSPADRSSFKPREVIAVKDIEETTAKDISETVHEQRESVLQREKDETGTPTS